MAKGTLQAAARTTKKSSTSLKGGKSAIIGGGGGGGASDKPAAAAAATSSNKKSKKSTAASSSGSLDDAPAAPASDDVVLVVNGVEKRKLNVKDQRYMKHYKAIVKESLEGGEMLHCKEQDNVETILKLFDLNPEFGPAVGLTRLDRWKRASAWGLDPPEEVLDILTTIEGEKEARYRESLFDGMV